MHTDGYSGPQGRTALSGGGPGRAGGPQGKLVRACSMHDNRYGRPAGRPHGPYKGGGGGSGEGARIHVICARFRRELAHISQRICEHGRCSPGRRHARKALVVYPGARRKARRGPVNISHTAGALPAGGRRTGGRAGCDNRILGPRRLSPGQDGAKKNSQRPPEGRGGDTPRGGGIALGCTKRRGGPRPGDGCPRLFLRQKVRDGKKRDHTGGRRCKRGRAGARWRPRRAGICCAAAGGIIPGARGAAQGVLS
ncbi:hypothetical protein CENSYa_0701 [Cenarchaeum symbiosum A]|uniref:Uncharacterized protein n=1 Tax=Cenarchaeum symbiosum (strain A) TaxID=414004 RepID=A0RVG7_CENSY|nr:hypothetical protein CENSYa_0701 [Cenarchaeum symbiosum A]